MDKQLGYAQLRARLLLHLLTWTLGVHGFVAEVAVLQTLVAAAPPTNMNNTGN